MNPSTRRAILVGAVAAPILTALIMAGLIFSAWRRGALVVADPAADPRQAAIASLSGAAQLPPDEAVRLADDADHAAGVPLVEACLVRMDAAHRRRDPAGERKEADRALALDPTRPEAQMARILIAAERWASAAIPDARLDPIPTTFAVSKAVAPATLPDLPARLDGRPARTAELLRLLQAGSDLRSAPDLWSEVSSGPIDPRLAFALGVYSLRRDDAPAGLSWLRAALAGDPVHPGRFRALMIAELLAGNLAEALDVGTRWRAAAPDAAEPWAWAAAAHRKLGDVKKAAESLDGAVRIDAKYRGARGWAEYARGDRSKALEDAEAAKETDPAARHLRAVLHRDAGEFKAALAACDMILAVRTGFFEALALRADCLAKLGRDEDAVAAWKRAIEADPVRTEARLGLAEHYRATGRREEALALYSELSDLPEAHAKSALLLLELGRHSQALYWAEMGVRRHPNDARLQIVLGRIRHARLDHFGEWAAYDAAVRLDPRNVEAKKLLDECLRELKRE
jgi:tetratricopeptide (TPR) repeat protein